MSCRTSQRQQDTYTHTYKHTHSHWGRRSLLAVGKCLERLIRAAEGWGAPFILTPLLSLQVSGKQTEKTGTIRKHGASVRFGSPLQNFGSQQLLVFAAETHTGSPPAVSCVSVSGPTKLRSQFSVQWRPLLEGKSQVHICKEVCRAERLHLTVQAINFA